MRVAGVFSELGIGVICAGLLVATLAGAEPASDALLGISAAAKAAAEAVTAPQGETEPQAPVPATVAVAPVPEVLAPDAANKSIPAVASGAPAQTAVAAQPPTAVATATVEAPKALSGVATLKPAKALFGAVKQPTKQSARAIGGYAKGCLAGAQGLPVDGPAWQVMRLSRNRNWGHPKLIGLIEKLAADAKAKDGWPGLLVGDLSQPRGGPMVSGHASHQVGLDVDVWLTPMPDHTLSRDEREAMGAQSVLSDDSLSVVREKWSDAHTNLIRRAASYPEVERVLVHPAIKQVLCYAASGDRSWLSKVRPYWGHDEHIHIRIGCPQGSAECHAQPAPPGDEGCGKELEDWLKRIENLKQPAPPVPAPPVPVPPTTTAKPAAPKEKPATTLVDLPEACRPVLAEDNPNAAQDIAEAIKVEKGGHQKAIVATAKAAHTKTASASKLGGPKPATREGKAGAADMSKASGPDMKKN